MPEFYAEPMKDRQCCFVCKKTVTGKKVLLTCVNCHAITYCGVECQRTDWPRHEWNCVPVMVTEFPGKGRGLVAARDIEKGELIFKDKPVIKLAVDADGRPADPLESLISLKQQIESLPAEAKLQYYKLTIRDDANFHILSRNDNEALGLFLTNCTIYKVDVMGEEKHALLHLNLALVNHSCAPNAASRSLKQKGDEDRVVELRAIKKICKGEEITICYFDFDDLKKFGSILRKRKAGIKKDFNFDCKCPVCLGQCQVTGQEKILKKLIELHNKVNLTTPPYDWKRDANIWSRIVDLSMELKIGHPFDKISASEALAGFAYLARDKDLMKKAMDMLKHFAEEYKLDSIQRTFKVWEKCLEDLSAEFSSNNAPEMREIEFIVKAIEDEV